jgi:membrane-bound metal-dependent hydrolase YbcI (DUF457 family)
MDFFTHILIGIVLGRLFFNDIKKQKAIILGCILPDFDIFLAWLPSIIPQMYIFSHRGIFHSIITLLIVFPIIVFLLRYISKKFRNIKDDLTINITTSTYLIGVIGSYIHLFMDLLNPQGLVLFSPISSTRYTLSIMNFIEPLVSIPSSLFILYFAIKKYYKKQFFNKSTFDMISRAISVTFVFFILINTFLLGQTIATQKSDITSPGWIFFHRWVVIEDNESYSVNLVNQLNQKIERSYNFNKIKWNESEVPHSCKWTIRT